MGLACWLAALMALYVFLRTLAQYVPIKTHSKSAASHKEDILRMLHCGIAIAVLGGVSARLESGSAPPRPCANVCTSARGTGCW